MLLGEEELRGLDDLASCRGEAGPGCEGEDGALKVCGRVLLREDKGAEDVHGVCCDLVARGVVHRVEDGVVDQGLVKEPRAEERGDEPREELLLLRELEEAARDGGPEHLGAPPQRQQQRLLRRLGRRRVDQVAEQRPQQRRAVALLPRAQPQRVVQRVLEVLCRRAHWVALPQLPERAWRTLGARGLDLLQAQQVLRADLLVREHVQPPRDLLRRRHERVHLLHHRCTQSLRRTNTAVAITVVAVVAVVVIVGSSDSGCEGLEGHPGDEDWHALKVPVHLLALLLPLTLPLPLLLSIVVLTFTLFHRGEELPCARQARHSLCAVVAPAGAREGRVRPAAAVLAALGALVGDLLQHLCLGSLLCAAGDGGARGVKVLVDKQLCDVRELGLGEACAGREEEAVCEAASQALDHELGERVPAGHQGHPARKVLCHERARRDQPLLARVVRQVLQHHALCRLRRVLCCPRDLAPADRLHDTRHGSHRQPHQRCLCDAGYGRNSSVGYPSLLRSKGPQPVHRTPHAHTAVQPGLDGAERGLPDALPAATAAVAQWVRGVRGAVLDAEGVEDPVDLVLCLLAVPGRGADVGEHPEEAAEPAVRGAEGRAVPAAHKDVAHKGEHRLQGCRVPRPQQQCPQVHVCALDGHVPPQRHQAHPLPQRGQVLLCALHLLWRCCGCCCRCCCLCGTVCGDAPGCEAAADLGVDGSHDGAAEAREVHVVEERRVDRVVRLLADDALQEVLRHRVQHPVVSPGPREAPPEISRHPVDVLRGDGVQDPTHLWRDRCVATTSTSSRATTSSCRNHCCDACIELWCQVFEALCPEELCCVCREAVTAVDATSAATAQDGDKVCEGDCAVLEALGCGGEHGGRCVCRRGRDGVEDVLHRTDEVCAPDSPARHELAEDVCADVEALLRVAVDVRVLLEDAVHCVAVLRIAVTVVVTTFVTAIATGSTTLCHSDEAVDKGRDARPAAVDACEECLHPALDGPRALRLEGLHDRGVCGEASELGLVARADAPQEGCVGRLHVLCRRALQDVRAACREDGGAAGLLSQPALDVDEALRVRVRREVDSKGGRRGLEEHREGCCAGLVAGGDGGEDGPEGRPVRRVHVAEDGQHSLARARPEQPELRGGAPAGPEERLLEQQPQLGALPAPRQRHKEVLWRAPERRLEQHPHRHGAPRVLGEPQQRLHKASLAPRPRPQPRPSKHRLPRKARCTQERELRPLVGPHTEEERPRERSFVGRTGAGAGAAIV